MKKVLLIALALIMVLAPIARAEGQEAPMAEAQKSFQPFELDGEEAKIGGYLINANNYYKLRDLAALLNGTDKQFNIVFDDVKKQIALELGKPYEKLDTDLQEMKHDKTTAKMVTNTILVDGKEVELKAALIDRNNYVKLRDLGPVVGFNVDYNNETKAIIVDTKAEVEAEEEKVEEKSEEKKEEKKEEVKAKELNASIDEIKAFLADEENRKKYGLNEFRIEEENGKYYFIEKGQNGSEAAYRIENYQAFDSSKLQEQIQEQTDYFYSLNKGDSASISYETVSKIYFLNKDLLKDNKIDSLTLANNLNFTLAGKQKLFVGIQDGALYIPFFVNKDGEVTIAPSVMGQAAVMVTYGDSIANKPYPSNNITNLEVKANENGADMTSIMLIMSPADSNIVLARVILI